MRNLKKYIVLLCLILSFVGIFLVIILNSLGKITNEENTNKNEAEQTYKERAFIDVKEYKTYYTVKEIINNYIIHMKEINGDQYVETGKIKMTTAEIAEALQKEGLVAIKGLLDKQYVEEMSIDDNMIKLAQNKYKQNGTYDKQITYNLNIEKMSEYDINENIKIVLVEAKLNDEQLKMIIKLDYSNGTHSLFFEDYIEKYNYSKDTKIKDIKIKEEILPPNAHNKYLRVDASEVYIVSQYFSEYRMKMINDSKTAYELLDTQYKKEKFTTYENFIKYVKNNEQKILCGSVEKYQINENNGIKEYVCIDNNGKYYIFSESGVGKYKVVLDTYTIDLPEFLEKYNSNSNEIKAGYNIQKIFDAIKDGDYNYAYKKLDNTFKQNNFPTEESFENYAKQHFLVKKLTHNKVEKSGNLYIYDMSVTQDNNNILKKTFIIKLLEGTDFVFSFNI